MSNVNLFPARLRREAREAEPSCAQRPRDRRAAYRRSNRSGYRRCLAWLLAGGIGLTGAAPAIAGPTCKPTLAVTQVQFSEMRKPTLERRWTATVTADASRCTTTAGYFEIGISRMKEYGPELEFREQFIWSTPSVTIGIDFWADEAVEAYWVDSIQACPCAR
jgi:hypothetical protein